MRADVLSQPDYCKMRLQGKFDHAVSREFNTALQDALRHQQSEIRIDFAAVEYLDSSALGMLLMAKEKAGKAGKTITLANATGMIAKAFDFAKFKSIFKIV